MYSTRLPSPHVLPLIRDPAARAATLRAIVTRLFHRPPLILLALQMVRKEKVNDRRSPSCRA